MTEQFKKGDKVRVVRYANTSLAYDHVGAEGTVVRLDADLVLVTTNRRTEWPYERSEIELIERKFEGFKKGDRVRFEAKIPDSAYVQTPIGALPSVYNGIVGTVESDVSPWDVVSVKWDIPEVKQFATFPENIVVIERPEPARETVTVEFTYPVTEDIVGALADAFDDSKFEYDVKEKN